MDIPVPFHLNGEAKHTISAQWMVVIPSHGVTKEMEAGVTVKVGHV